MNLNRMLRDAAVYWARSSPDGYGGYSWAAPVEIRCRVFDGADLRHVAGLVLRLDVTTVVYTDTKVEEGGRLWKGKLEDLSSDQKADPTSVAYCREIEKVARTESLRGGTVIWRATLK